MPVQSCWKCFCFSVGMIFCFFASSGNDFLFYDLRASHHIRNAYSSSACAVSGYSSWLLLKVGFQIAWLCADGDILGWHCKWTSSKKWRKWGTEKVKQCLVLPIYCEKASLNHMVLVLPRQWYFFSVGSLPVFQRIASGWQLVTLQDLAMLSSKYQYVSLMKLRPVHAEWKQIKVEEVD